MNVPAVRSDASSEKPVTAAQLHNMMDTLASGPGLSADHSRYFHVNAPVASTASEIVATNP
jgi:hypothetical protein